MGYDESHTEDECDKCLERVGKNNLVKVEFVYLDKNDRMHEDQSQNMITAYAEKLTTQGLDFFTAMMIAQKKISPGYKQYYVCAACKAKGI